MKHSNKAVKFAQVDVMHADLPSTSIHDQPYHRTKNDISYLFNL